MRTILAIFLIAIVTYFLQLILPWWGIVLMPFIVGIVISRKGLGAFFSGFFGIALVWLLISLLISIKTDFVLTDKISAIFNLPSGYFLILLTAILGGIIGGFWGLTGFYLKRIFVKPTKKNKGYELS